MSNKQEIAEKLGESGMFDWVDDVLAVDLKDGTSFVVDGLAALQLAGINGYEYGENEIGPWPTADQSEALLAAIGLQVVWVDTEEEWQLGQFKDFCLDECSETWVELGGAFDIPKGQRTLANNAALAWLCDNKTDELKTAIEEVSDEQR